MSKPRRQPGPIRRTIVQARTAPTTPGQNPALRPATVVESAVPVRRTRAVKMTGAQRDTNGARSDWSKPMTLRPHTTPMMPAWSHTVTNRPAGTTGRAYAGWRRP